MPAAIILSRRRQPECTLRGECGGPLSFLAALLSPHAVLVEPTRIESVALVTAPNGRRLDTPISTHDPA